MRAQPGAGDRVGELEAARRAAPVGRLVHEHQAQRLQERGVAGAVRREVGRAVVVAAQRRDRDALARDERSRRHLRRQLPVEAEDELGRLVVVGEEAGHIQAVDRARAGLRVRLAPVQRERARPDAAEEPRAAAPQVPEHASRLPAVRLEESGGERVRHDEVPVAPVPGGGQRAVGALAVEERHGHEERAPRQPSLRAAHRAAQASLEPAGERAARRGQVPVARLLPHPRHRAQPLPHDRLRVQAVDRRGDVRRVALAVQQPVPVRADLAAEPLDVAAQRRASRPRSRPCRRTAARSARSRRAARPSSSSCCAGSPASPGASASCAARCAGSRG